MTRDWTVHVENIMFREYGIEPNDFLVSNGEGETPEEFCARIAEKYALERKEFSFAPKNYKKFREAINSFKGVGGEGVTSCNQPMEGLRLPYNEGWSDR